MKCKSLPHWATTLHFQTESSQTYMEKPQGLSQQNLLQPGLLPIMIFYISEKKHDAEAWWNQIQHLWHAGMLLVAVKGDGAFKNLLNCLIETAYFCSDVWWHWPGREWLSPGLHVNEELSWYVSGYIHAELIRWLSLSKFLSSCVYHNDSVIIYLSS